MFRLDPTPKVFLAGGITDCPDWQENAKGALLKLGYTVFNPRRASFPIDDPTAAQEQIEWEYDGLKYADVILFWFPEGAIQPIALFELGRWSPAKMGKLIAVGCDPNYERRQDVEIQMSLVGIEVKHTLDNTIRNVMKLIAPPKPLTLEPRSV